MMRRGSIYHSPVTAPENDQIGRAGDNSNRFESSSTLHGRKRDPKTRRRITISRFIPVAECRATGRRGAGPAAETGDAQDRCGNNPPPRAMPNFRQLSARAFASASISALIRSSSVLTCSFTAGRSAAPDTVDRAKM